MTDNPQKIRVWDSPVRLFHWTIVILIGVSWWSVEESYMEIHQWSGLAVLALVITRILWGFYGSTTARFADFMVGPGRIASYLRAIAGRTVPPVAGHTPTGGWMIMLLLGLLLLQPALGLFSHDDIFFEGPLAPLVSSSLSDRLTELHETTFTLLQIAALLHILAVLWYRLWFREDLIRPMITGWRPWTGAPPRPLAFTHSLWALATLILVAGLIYFFILI